MSWLPFSPQCCKLSQQMVQEMGWCNCSLFPHTASLVLIRRDECFPTTSFAIKGMIVLERRSDSIRNTNKVQASQLKSSFLLNANCCSWFTSVSPVDRCKWLYGHLHTLTWSVISWKQSAFDTVLQGKRVAAVMRSFGNTDDTFQKNILYATCVISDNPIYTLMYSQWCHSKFVYIIKENMKPETDYLFLVLEKVTIKHGILSLPDWLR